MIRSVSKIFAGAAVALALSVTSNAHAETLELKFIGTDVWGDIFATTSSTHLVTAISGQVGDTEVGPGPFTVTGLSSYAASDNKLAGSDPFVSLGGLSFTTAGGGDYNFANLASYNNGGYVLLSSVLDPGGGVSSVGMTSLTFSVTSIPEPSNLALMAAGLLGLLGVTRRRMSR